MLPERTSHFPHVSERALCNDPSSHHHQLSLSLAIPSYGKTSPYPFHDNNYGHLVDVLLHGLDHRHLGRQKRVHFLYHWKGFDKDDLLQSSTGCEIYDDSRMRPE